MFQSGTGVRRRKGRHVLAWKVACRRLQGLVSCTWGLAEAIRELFAAVVVVAAAAVAVVSSPTLRETAFARPSCPGAASCVVATAPSSSPRLTSRAFSSLLDRVTFAPRSVPLRCLRRGFLLGLGFATLFDRSLLQEDCGAILCRGLRTVAVHCWAET